MASNPIFDNILIGIDAKNGTIILLEYDNNTDKFSVLDNSK
jgi:hypothetical protein